MSFRLKWPIGGKPTGRRAEAVTPLARRPERNEVRAGAGPGCCPTGERSIEPSGLHGLAPASDPASSTDSKETRFTAVNSEPAGAALTGERSAAPAELFTAVNSETAPADGSEAEEPASVAEEAHSEQDKYARRPLSRSSPTKRPRPASRRPAQPPPARSASGPPPMRRPEPASPRRGLLLGRSRSGLPATYRPDGGADRGPSAPWSGTPAPASTRSHVAERDPATRRRG